VDRQGGRQGGRQEGSRGGWWWGGRGGGVVVVMEVMMMLHDVIHHCLLFSGLVILITEHLNFDSLTYSLMVGTTNISRSSTYIIRLNFRLTVFCVRILCII
jgi:hypothetical protein